MNRMIPAALVAAFALAAPALARADTVTEWNLNASMAVAAQPPQQSVPHLAMVQGAVYDAVNAIDGGHDGYLLTSRVGSPFDSKEAAAATAAYRVLLSLPGAQKSALDAAVRGVARRHRRRRPEDPRHRRGRGGGCGDDRGAHGRRPLRAGRLPARPAGPGRLGAGAARASSTTPTPGCGT